MHLREDANSTRPAAVKEQRQGRDLKDADPGATFLWIRNVRALTGRIVFSQTTQHPRTRPQPSYVAPPYHVPDMQTRTGRGGGRVGGCEGGASRKKQAAEEEEGEEGG